MSSRARHPARVCAARESLFAPPTRRGWVPFPSLRSAGNDTFQNGDSFASRLSALILLPDSGFFDRVRDFRARVVDFIPPDFDPFDRFEAPREVALAVFEPLLRDEVFAVERDLGAALLRDVLDLDLLELAAARLLLLFAVREPAALDRPRDAADFVLRLLLPVRRAPPRELLLLRVERPRREPRPPVSVIPVPDSSPEPAISISDPFLRAMCVSYKCAPMGRNPEA